MPYYRLMTVLPALPDRPEPPAWRLEQVWAAVAEELEGRALEAAQAVIEFLDCRNLESILLDRQAFDERARLTREQLAEREGLPEYMANFLAAWDSGAVSGPYPLDGLWRAYFSHLHEIGVRARSRFLQDWATWEVAVRNALARERAGKLGWEAEARLAEPLHGEPATEELLVQVREATEPLERKRILDQARLQAIEALAGRDPFGLDAVLAYLASMLVLDSWVVPAEVDLDELLEAMG